MTPSSCLCLYMVFIKVNTTKFLCGIYLSDMKENQIQGENSARCLMVLNISMKFHENTLNCFRVI